MTMPTDPSSDGATCGYQISRRRKRSDAPPTPRRDSARQMARTAA
jgi:hypothetical protein